MVKTYKVLFPLIEYSPLARVGSLGDKLSILIESLNSKEGVSISICLPFYQTINKILKAEIKKINIEPIEILNSPTNFFESTLDGVKIYLVENQEYFGRNKSIYETNDVYRFTFFSSAIIKLLDLVENPDIIHIHDWHLGFLPLFLKIYNKKIKSLLTLHDITHQGVCEADIISFANISYKYFYSGEIEFYKKVNILKAGMEYSDLINTISKDYYSLISENNAFSGGLNGIIKALKNKFRNITDGLDDSYNPEKDPQIYANYSYENLYGKIECKINLQKELNMPVHTEIPLMIIPAFNISKHEEKGLNLIIAYLIKMEIQIVILGNKLSDFEKNIKKIPFRMNCSVTSIEYSELNLRKLLSAGDIILDTSFNFSNVIMIKKALKYGVIPILSQESKDLQIEDNYFRLFNFTAEDLINTIKYSINKYYYLESWNEKVKKIMSYDFSLNKASDEYLILYEELLYS